MDFSPSIYEYAAQVIGRPPWDVSRDADLLFEAHAQAHRLYRHQPIVVGIDIYNLEAEGYGAVVQQPDDTDIPAIVGHPFGDLRDVANLPAPNGRAARCGMVIDVARRLKREFPSADVRVPLGGPFSIAANLCGFDVLLETVADREEVALAALVRLAKNQLPFARRIAQAGVDVAFFESAAAPPLISPGQFRRLELPAVGPLLAETARIVGHAVPFIMGGDTLPILDSILEMACQYVVAPSETNQPAFLAAMADHPKTMVRVNMDHRIVAGGSWEAIRREADRVIALARTRKASCVGTGVVPYETPGENLLRLREYVGGVQ